MANTKKYHSLISISHSSSNNLDFHQVSSPVVYFRTPACPQGGAFSENGVHHSGVFLYRCQCGGRVKVILHCAEEKICKLICDQCKFHAYIGIGLHEAIKIFRENDYNLPKNFYDIYEI